MTTTPRRAGLARLNDLAVNDAGFVFDPSSGATFSVNPAGRLILEHLKRGDTRARIAAELEASFDVAADHDLTRDIDGFVHLLRTHNLVPRDFSL